MFPASTPTFHLSIANNTVWFGEFNTARPSTSFFFFFVCVPPPCSTLCHQPAHLLLALCSLLNCFAPWLSALPMGSESCWYRTQRLRHKGTLVLMRLQNPKQPIVAQPLDFPSQSGLLASAFTIPNHVPPPLLHSLLSSFLLSLSLSINMEHPHLKANVVA